jgi:hypothetical protein
MSFLKSGIFCATFVTLDGIAKLIVTLFVVGYATFVGLAKLTATSAKYPAKTRLKLTAISLWSDVEYRSYHQSSCSYNLHYL